MVGHMALCICQNPQTITAERVNLNIEKLISSHLGGYGVPRQNADYDRKKS